MKTSVRITKIENYIQDTNFYHNNKSAFHNAVEYIKSLKLYNKMETPAGCVSIGVWDDYNKHLTIYNLPDTDYPELSPDSLYIIRQDHIYDNGDNQQPSC